MFCMLACTVLFYSCGTDDDVSGDGSVDPNKEIPDPTGTIQIAMRNSNNGKTSLNGIYIDNENFAGGFFASLGSVRGLGNVAHIPTTGWGGQVSVIPGHGYVAYKGTEFYRIYVIKDLVGISGGIIGSEIKYQAPFKGNDEEIKLDSTDFKFPFTGGQKDIVFKNSGVILFDVETDVPNWCTVQKTSTYDYSFLTNGIHISVKAGTSTETEHGTITLTTLYGKKTVINLTRSGAKPFVSFGDLEEKEFSAAAQTAQIECSGNVPLEELIISSSVSWCKVEKEKIQSSQKIEGTSNLMSYRILLDCEANVSKNEREAMIFIRSQKNNVGDTLLIKQSGAKITLIENLELGASQQINSVSIASDINIDDVKIESSAVWCSANINKSTSKLEISVEENSSDIERSAVLSFKGKDNTILATLNVKQLGITFNIEKNQIGFDKYSHYQTIEINTNFKNWEAESSADWCALSQNGNQLTIRVTSSNIDRIAIISFKGFNVKLTVHQSKYAVKDAFNEDGIEGIVGYIGDDFRLVYRELESTAWSSEYVITGANSSTDGEYNMNIIKNIPFWEDHYPAFQLFEQLNTNGISGWYLPAINELKKLDLSGDYYWSSTETLSSQSYACNGSYNSNFLKASILKIVAVHKF